MMTMSVILTITKLCMINVIAIIVIMVQKRARGTVAEENAAAARNDATAARNCGWMYSGNNCNSDIAYVDDDDGVSGWIHAN